MRYYKKINSAFVILLDKTVSLISRIGSGTNLCHEQKLIRAWPIKCWPPRKRILLKNSDHAVAADTSLNLHTCELSFSVLDNEHIILNAFTSSEEGYKNMNY